MTFTEAAAHVLRLVGKPLHYKEITDVAIERDLLSHVGKSPEVTMGARLAAVVKKDPKDNPLMRVKPGVFALRDWDEAAVAEGLADRTPALERLARLEVEQQAAEQASASEEAPSEESPAEEESPDSQETVEAAPATSLPPLSIEVDGDEGMGEDERARAELAASATDIFTPEEDDDEPILGGGADSEDEGGERDGSSKRRRRRRRRRPGSEEEPGLPSYTVSEAPPLAAEGDEEAPSSEGLARDSVGRDGGGRDSVGREGGGRDSGSREGGGRDSGSREGGGRDSRGRDGGSREGGGRRSEGRGRSGEGPAAAEGRASLEDLSAGSVLAMLEQLMSPRARTGSTPLRQLAEQGAKRGRSRVESQALQDAIADAVRGETIRARLERRRPRFVLSGKSVTNTAWGMDEALVSLEKDLANTVAKYREAFARSFAERIRSLGARSLEEFFRLFLAQIGLEGVQPIRRPGSHNQELHFAAAARSAAGEVQTAILLRKDGRDIGRERVVELRGALHHYGNAHAGMLVTTGQILSGAREEARADNAAPVQLVDGIALARLAEEHGVGVVDRGLKVPTFDLDLLDSLGGS